MLLTASICPFLPNLCKPKIFHQFFLKQVESAVNKYLRIESEFRDFSLSELKSLLKLAEDVDEFEFGFGFGIKG